MTIEDLGSWSTGNMEGQGSVRAAACREFQLTLRLGRSLALPILVLAGFLICATSQAQNNGPTHSDALKKRISISWTDVQLRDALFNLAETQEVPIFLDRRVDPNQKFNFKASDTSVAEIIYQVAEQSGCGICWLGDVAYVGPLQDVAAMAVLRVRLVKAVRKLPTARKRRLIAEAPLRIPRLAQPNDLLAALFRNLDLDVPESSLPHDLWPAYEIESMQGVDRILLLACGFSFWPSLSENGRLALVEFPEVAAGESRMRLPSGKSRETLSKLKIEFPDAKLRGDRKYVVAAGSPLQLYQIRRAIDRIEYQGDSKTTVPGGTKVVSGRIKVSIGQALKTAANGLSLELKYDPSLRSILLKQIDINVRQLTFEQLAERVLEGTGLTFTVSNGELLVERKVP